MTRTDGGVGGVGEREAQQPTARVHPQLPEHERGVAAHRLLAPARLIQRHAVGSGEGGGAHQAAKHQVCLVLHLQLFQAKQNVWVAQLPNAPDAIKHLRATRLIDLRVFTPAFDLSENSQMNYAIIETSYK